MSKIRVKTGLPISCRCDTMSLLKFRDAISNVGIFFPAKCCGFESYVRVQNPLARTCKYIPRRTSFQATDATPSDKGEILLDTAVFRYPFYFMLYRGLQFNATFIRGLTHFCRSRLSNALFSLFFCIAPRSLLIDLSRHC